MNELRQPLDVGLEMLAQRWNVLGKTQPPGKDVLAKVSEQIALARAPWGEALETLSPHAKITTILQDLYPQILPYLIKGYENSAVHHIAYTASFMAQIAVVELPQHYLKPGVIAALLHDIGSGDSFLPKVTEEMIRKAPESERDALREKGIRYRREHMDEGVKISRKLLNSYRAEHRSALTDDDIDVILDVVGTHDDCKIPLMEKAVNKKWLLSPTRKGRDWIKQCHWEADALWMLCPAGILIDMEREKEEDMPENRTAKSKFNWGLHCEIVEVYAKAYLQQELTAFGFHKGSLYRSETGYAIAERFRKQLNAL